MENKNIFSDDHYFGKYEQIVRAEIGKELNGLKQLINQIENRCTIRIMNINFNRSDKQKPLSVDELISCEKNFRCKTLAALIYNDALWRLEAAHLMMCIGLLNIAYANLRTSVEFFQTAFIIERCDAEALKFLENKEVNLKLMDGLLVNSEYSNQLQKLKELYTKLGVHRYLSSLQLSSLFGASRFDKYVTESTKIPKSLQLPSGFSDAAKMCIQQGGQVGILFSWLESIPVKD